MQSVISSVCGETGRRGGGGSCCSFSPLEWFGSLDIFVLHVGVAIDGYI